jgi:phosphate-selective porin OprO/OprP
MSMLPALILTAFCCAAQMAGSTAVQLSAADLNSLALLDSLGFPPAPAPGVNPDHPGSKASTQAPKPVEPPSPEAGKGSDGPQFTFREGFVGQTSDGAFRYHVGGRIDWDNAWYQVPANIQQSLGTTPLLDGTDLRRFRLGIDGVMWKQMDFKLEVDLSRASDFTGFKSEPQTNIFLTDAWIAYHDLPVVDTVRFGHQKEYFTWSNATSAKFTPFMERPYIFDAFENPFSWDEGVSTYRSYLDQSVTSWAGVFWNGTRSQAFNNGGHYGASGRLTWMPIYSEEEQSWLCFSASGSLRSFGPNDPNFIIVRPLVRAGQSFDVPVLLQTGTLFTRDGLEVAGAGAHGAWGPLTVGAEFLTWSLSNVYSGHLPLPNGQLPAGARSLGNLFLSGYYAEILLFLTPGDHRPVNRSIPGYDRVVPVENFSWTSTGFTGTGAVEVGLRFDEVNLDSGNLQAGRLDSLTAGLNWYLNPNAKFMVNYVWTYRNLSSTSSGTIHALGVRLHFDL